MRFHCFAGWLWSHGYNYFERDNDRRFIFEHLLEDKNDHAYNLLRKHGIQYILGVSLVNKKHAEHERRVREYEQKKAELQRAASAGQANAMAQLGPDPHVGYEQFKFLSNRVNRIYAWMQYEVFEVN